MPTQRLVIVQVSPLGPTVMKGLNWTPWGLNAKMRRVDSKGGRHLSLRVTCVKGYKRMWSLDGKKPHSSHSKYQIIYYSGDTCFDDVSESICQEQTYIEFM